MFVFDFDGVLADTQDIYAQVCRDVAKNLGHDKHLPDNPFENLDPVTFEAMGKVLGLNEKQFASEVALAMKGYSFMPLIFEGIPLVLDKLSQQMPIGILSAGPSHIIHKILSYHGIDNCFDFVIGGDSSGSKADKLTALKQEYGNVLVMIGDSASDIDAANTAEVISIAVTWGWQSEKLLLTRKPNYLAHTPSQLLEIAEKIKESTLT